MSNWERSHIIRPREFRREANLALIDQAIDGIRYRYPPPLAEIIIRSPWTMIKPYGEPSTGIQAVFILGSDRYSLSTCSQPSKPELNIIKSQITRPPKTISRY